MEEIKCHIIQHSCLPVLCYGVDALRLHEQKVHELSVTYNTSIRTCFYLSRFVFVRLILHYTGSLPMKVLLDERYILLIKDCLGVSSTSDLKMCALIASNESGFNDMCVGYSVHHNMPRSAIRAMFGEALRLSLGLH